jgi:hypothetical protein
VCKPGADQTQPGPESSGYRAPLCGSAQARTLGRAPAKRVAASPRLYNPGVNQADAVEARALGISRRITKVEANFTWETRDGQEWPGPGACPTKNCPSFSLLDRTFIAFIYRSRRTCLARDGRVIPLPMNRRGFPRSHVRNVDSVIPSTDPQQPAIYVRVEGDGVPFE